MKKAIRYLRFSSDGQSNSSIEKQDLYTGQWAERNDVKVIDTFIDEGYSAKTFDRPDFIELQDFLSRHHNSVDFLVVDQMDRFSRDAGEAMSLVKKLQLKYHVQIVSVTEGITFDYHTPGSFFRAGLQLLLAEEDNINRTHKVNGGIYTAKAKEGRYIYGHPPYGYKKEGTGKSKHLVIDDYQATIVRYIYDAFLQNTPFYLIKKEAKKMGYTRTGNSIMKHLLQNPVYAGMQYVKPFRELPGGVFPANHEAIIDAITWDAVQRKLQAPEKTKVVMVDEVPLRGLLKCYCGQNLTAAPSKSRSGAYYYYYKCNKSRHLNLSAKKAHDQLDEILDVMSLSAERVAEIRAESELIFADRVKKNKLALQEKRRELSLEESKMISVEEKWITNQISQETYQRWHTDVSQRKFNLKAQIERLSKDQKELFVVLFENLDKLTNLKQVYHKATTVQKHELLRMVFDSNLYYQNGLYRTTRVIGEFAHNALILQEKGLLEIDEKKKWDPKVPLSADDRNRTYMGHPARS